MVEALPAMNAENQSQGSDNQSETSFVEGVEVQDEEA